MKAIRTVSTVVRSVSPAGNDIVLLELADPEDWVLPPFRPGNHIDAHLPNGLVRSYSLCGDPAQNNRYFIAVKRELAGRGGSAAVHALRPGDVVPVSLPRGTFIPVAAGSDHVFIAGGIGVTPFLAMASQLRSQYTLHVLHRGERPLAQFTATQLPEEPVHYYQTGSGQPRVNLRTLLGDPAPGKHIYCCGPDSLMDAVVDATQSWPAGQVHIEHFIPPERPVDADAKPYQVELKLSKKTFSVSPEISLLAALREHDVDVDAACEGGICGACRVRWLDGEPVHHDRVLTDDERKREVIVCVSGCTSERLVLEL